MHVCVCVCTLAYIHTLAWYVYYCLSFVSVYSLQVDIYGTQQPIALLKLLLERGGMYDRGKDLNWKVYKDIGFLAAMGKVYMYIYLLLHVCSVPVYIL